MLEVEVFLAYEFYKKISKVYRAKEYTREITKTIQRVNKVYDQKYTKSALSQSFAIIKKNNKNLIFKKNKSKRRALTKRETANVKDIAKRRRIRANKLKIARKEKYTEFIQLDTQPVSAFL